MIWITLFVYSLEGRIYFLHVPKTGGTTLRLMLEMQVAESEIYPYRNRKDAKDPMKESLISGHFPYWLCKKLDPDFEQAFKITILRDPVERYLSYLRAKKKRDNLPNIAAVMQLKDSEEESNNINFRDNVFCRDLAASPFLEGEALLESAKETLRNFDYIIFFDHFAEDVSELFARLGISLEMQDIPVMNFNSKEPVSEDILKEVQELNKLDMQLYAYAKTNLPLKKTKHCLRTKSFNQLLVKTNIVDYTFDLPLNGKMWSYREQLESKKKDSTYRWVMDQPAQIYFSLKNTVDYHLYFTAQPLTSEVLPRVNVNGKEIEITKLNNNLFSLYHGLIPKDLLTNDETEISFYASKSFFYRDIYPAFTHKKDPPFSFAVNRIVIIE